MPRKKKTDENELRLDRSDVLMLPPPQTVVRTSAHRKHEKHEDPYEAAIAAVPKKVSTKSRPSSRTLSPAEREQQAELAAAQAASIDRYHAYLDALAANGGNRIAALARAFELDADTVVARERELLGVIAAGRDESPVTKLLERADLDLAARIALLRQHAYSDNQAASLKAIDMVDALVGAGGELGSFESYLRVVKAQA